MTLLLNVTDEDERLHPVEDASPYWSDSLFFDAWDPASGTALLTRMAVLPNQAKATAGFLVWRDGAPSYGYGHEHAGPAPGDWDVMSIGGVTYRMEQGCQRWSVRLDEPAGDARAFLTWDGFTSCFPYDRNPTPLPKVVAWGHYEQTCRVTGDLVIGGDHVRFDGVGQRDHSWGFRQWAGVREWHWVTGFFGPSGTELSFNIFHVTQHDGTVTVNGFVHSDGNDLAVVAVERETDVSATGAPQGFRLRIEVDGGRRFEVDGVAAATAVLVHPDATPAAVHELPMRLRSGDLDGHGFYELVDNP